MKIVFLALCLVTCLSCGGADNGTIPLAPKVRQFQKGDTWTYTFSGTFTPLGGQSVPVTGTVIHQVTDRNGETVTVSHELTFTTNGETFAPVHQWAKSKQHPDGSSEPLQDNGGINQATRTVTSNTVKSFGFWTVPMSWSGKVAFDDGSWARVDTSVNSTQPVATAVGTFDAFVAVGKSTTSFGNITETTDFDVPGIGAWVARNEKATNSNGVIQVSYTLVSTNVPLPKSL